MYSFYARWVHSCTTLMSMIILVVLFCFQMFHSVVVFTVCLLSLPNILCYHMLKWLFVIPQTIEEKSTVELRVTVTGSPEPQVLWYCNDKQLFETLKVKLLSESDGVHILHMERTTQQMSGLYRVTAVNTAGQTDHSATVTIAG